MIDSNTIKLVQYLRTHPSWLESAIILEIKQHLSEKVYQGLVQLLPKYVHDRYKSYGDTYAFDLCPAHDDYGAIIEYLTANGISCSLCPVFNFIP
jgi:hypothetical protein